MPGNHPIRPRVVPSSKVARYHVLVGCLPGLAYPLKPSSGNKETDVVYHYA